MAKADVYAEALALIGQDPASPGDGSKAANFADIFYQPLVDAALRAVKWNCAVARSAKLAADATAPNFKWTYRYALPNAPDYCLKVWGLNDDEDAIYAVEGRYLMSNDSNVKIEFSKRVVDPDLWDAMLYQAITTGLASKLAAALLKDTKRALDLYKLYQAQLADAAAVDGQEGSRGVISSPDLINVRTA